MGSQHFEEKAACAALITAFAYYVDRRMYRELADLFTEDGSFQRPGLSVRSREELFASMSARTTEIETRHVCTAPMFTSISDDRAEAVTYFMMFQAAGVETGLPSFESPAAVAEYRDTFAKTDDGWRIASRVGVPAMIHKSLV
ncbi:nuclear transport factor 2 family protein [Novosphingobium colocasiae]|uniref:SnoaL-like domain-containing protein n=1 Tax=Novosphingobium colocasiae TaxID=1256513 RepID=A0A918PLK1_9SPHN|nr:nuclear transport factor 2 family protein [Novosphingobium colocasiae]GGZ15176.1 hypothetical protein GCM10011614_32620 [Novosphingobium colocasiae]